MLAQKFIFAVLQWLSDDEKRRKPILYSLSYQIFLSSSPFMYLCSAEKQVTVFSSLLIFMLTLHVFLSPAFFRNHTHCLLHREFQPSMTVESPKRKTAYTRNPSSQSGADRCIMSVCLHCLSTKQDVDLAMANVKQRLDQSQVCCLKKERCNIQSTRNIKLASDKSTYSIRDCTSKYDDLVGKKQ